MKYFWDSFAVIELLQGSRAYAAFKQEPITITIFNLVDIYWAVLRDLGAKKADEIFNRLRACVVDVGDETLRDAMQYRERHRKRRLSYADCIGYVYAKRKRMRFLTGDKEFKGVRNVRFTR